MSYYEDARAPGVTAYEAEFGIGNEFAGAIVRKAITRQGELLEIEIPSAGLKILLDAMQLEIVARQDPAWFSERYAASLDEFGESDKHFPASPGAPGEQS